MDGIRGMNIWRAKLQERRGWEGQSITALGMSGVLLFRNDIPYFRFILFFIFFGFDLLQHT